MQLEDGACLAAFDADVHMIEDLMPRDEPCVRLINTGDLDAIPGLVPS